MIPFNPSVPNVARIYDVFLGGKDNFGTDREAAAKLAKLLPDIQVGARQNREFLRRAVKLLVAEGITQFVDIGSGLPTVQNTHQTAQAENPGCRVAYIDYDPVVISHAQALLTADENVIAVGGDLRKPAEIIRELEVRDFIDFGRPVAVMLVAVLHFVESPACYEAVEHLKDEMPSGSYLVISHATSDETTEHDCKGVRLVYAGASAQAVPRGRAEIARFFDGLRLVEPGITSVGEWRSRICRSSRTLCYAGVGRKP